MRGDIKFLWTILIMGLLTIQETGAVTYTISKNVGYIARNSTTGIYHLDYSGVEQPTDIKTFGNFIARLGFYGFGIFPLREIPELLGRRYAFPFLMLIVVFFIASQQRKWEEEKTEQE